MPVLETAKGSRLSLRGLTHLGFGASASHRLSPWLAVLRHTAEFVLEGRRKLPIPPGGLSPRGRRTWR
jgi:hypothetical protein